MKKTSLRLFLIVVGLILITLWVDYPNSPGLHLNLGSLNFNKSFDTHLGLDLVGGVQALLEADLPSTTSIDANAMSAARRIVENRVNGLGVSEALVQQAGDRRILVEIPGASDTQKALESIQKTGLLEFVDFGDLSPEEARALENTLIDTDFEQSGSLSANPASPVAPSQGITSNQALTSTVPVAPARVFHTVMTGADLSNVSVTTDKLRNYQVAFELNSEGAQIFKDHTAQNVGKILAIILDKRVISAPRINSAIPDGKGVITGNFNNDTANQLAIQLRYGSLPIPLKVATSQTVGPTLGQLSLQKSLVAGLIGLTIVGLFMALYYRLPGVVADMALIVYALLTLALFKLIPVTLTLAGIAGFVLSIGMAVDANILIFSRLKEELRAGRPLQQAIDLGWGRAWPSIRDSNLSTLITCFILFWFSTAFGASIVKGFSLTLAIGVLVSMFTAIVVTRTFLHIVLDRLQFAEHPRWFGIGD
jgi:preprotein translocase subunit SecD